MCVGNIILFYLHVLELFLLPYHLTSPVKFEEEEGRSGVGQDILRRDMKSDEESGNKGGNVVGPTDLTWEPGTWTPVATRGPA